MSKRHGTARSARSVVARIEELVLASSGADAFELVFSLAAAQAVGRAVDDVRRRWPELGVQAVKGVPRSVLERASALLAVAQRDEALDAVFEELVPRVSKGNKGQFFTPRYVVDVATRALGLVDGEEVVDPACGSGAFLAHARAVARVKTRGFDVDPRAVRVAKLLALASGADPATITRADSLGPRPLARADVIATNPPFAGDVKTSGFEVADLVPRAERDALFLERCVAMLRAGGRLAIVLPHAKVASSSWAPLRRWLIDRARVFAVVSLPIATFAPHTTQRTVLLFAKKRARGERPSAGERVLFAVSERAGKEPNGEPSAGGHDLEPIAGELSRFFVREGFAS
jgi:type I restriction enzyme M protein